MVCTLGDCKKRDRYDAISMSTPSLVVNVAQRQVERVVFDIPCRNTDGGLVAS